MNTADITFVVLAKNEAARIRDCLRSVPPGSRVLVCDSQSSDGTAQIARDAGAEVADLAWRGFVQTRLDAAARVRTPWTFMLDADEQLSAQLAAEIAALAPDPSVSAYSVPRRNHFCGRWVRGAGWWPDRLVRLFRTGHARLVARSNGDTALHETWQPDGDVLRLANVLEHDSYPTLAAYRTKFERYTDIEAQAARPSALAIVGAAVIMPARVIWLLLGRGAIFDGWRGFYIAWYSALYPVVVAAKARARAKHAPSSLALARNTTSVRATARVILDARVTRQMSVGMIAYVRELALRLPSVAPDLDFVVVTNADVEPGPGAAKVQLPDRVAINGSVGEQFLLPGVLRGQREGRSLVHLMSVYAPRWTPQPYVYTIHDLIHLRFPAYFKWKVRPYYALVAAHTARNACAVITDANATIGDLQRFLGVAPEKARVVPLGVAERFSLDDAQRAQRAAVARERFGLQRPYLLYAGNHRAHKNLETLAAAWQRVAQPCDLVLTEDQPYSFDLDRYGRSDGRMVRPGHVSDEELLALYAGCAASVQPSLYEGFGLAVLESMAAGAPVIIAQTPALLEVAGDAALTFAAADAGALARAIQQVLASGAAISALREAGRARARSYTWDETTRKTAAIYREFLS